MLVAARLPDQVLVVFVINMQIAIPINKLTEEQRNTLLSKGELKNNCVHLEMEDYAGIIRNSVATEGLGDLVHKVAGPIGKAIHWPCNERDAAGNPTTNLRPGSPCAKARQLLNKIQL